MIQTQLLPDGRTYTYSDDEVKIMQTDTGIVYDTAVDTVQHTYTETTEPITPEPLDSDVIISELLEAIS